MGLKKYSRLRDANRQPIEKMLPLPFPISMYIEPINRCMFRCRYCPMSLADYEKEVGGFRTMTLFEFEKIANDIRINGPLKVLRFYFMGEPLLNPDLPDMITMAHQMKLAQRTELTSNGVLLTEPMSKRIIESGLDYLRISISSVNQNRHENITQTSIKVEKIFENIRSFRLLRDSMASSKPFLYVKLLYTGDPEDTAAFKNMYHNLADEIAIEQLMNWDGYAGNNFIIDAHTESRQEDFKHLYPYPKEVCPFPFYTLAITVNGDITVCCVDWNKSTKVGNVFQNSLKSIWDGDKIRNFRLMHIERQRQSNPSCRDCTFLHTVPDNIDHLSRNDLSALFNRNT